MPIDPNILSGLRPAQFVDPAEQYGRALTLRHLVNQGTLDQQSAQMNALQLDQARMHNQETQTGMDEEKAFKEAIARGARPGELLGISPKLGAAHLKGIIDRDKTDLENTKVRVQALSNALGAVKYAPEAERPARYQAVRADAIAKGLIQPEQAPEQYDPAFVDQHFNSAIDADKQVTSHQQALDFAQKIVDQAPKTAKEWMGVALDHASGAQSQQQLDQVRGVLDAMGAPKGVMKMIPSMWSDTAMQQLGKMAMSPEQRASDADRDASRAQTAAEGDKNRQVTREGHEITKTGQMLTDARSRELADLARQAAADARENKPPTEAMRTVATYAARLETSSGDLDRIHQGFGERVYNKVAPSAAQTEKGQAYDQAERNFINAVLRRESGAVISPSEFTEARKQYIPQPGDGKTVLEQKAINRKMVTESFKSAAGKAYQSPAELLGKPNGGGAGGQIQVTDPQGGVHTFTSKAQAEAFKKLAGIN